MLSYVCLINQHLKKMATRIFINLPVKDLEQSVSFFTALGYGHRIKRGRAAHGGQSKRAGRNRLCRAARSRLDVPAQLCRPRRAPLELVYMDETQLPTQHQ